MMAFLHILLTTVLAVSAPVRAKTMVISVDPGEPGAGVRESPETPPGRRAGKKKRGRKPRRGSRKKAKTGGGDVQVGHWGPDPAAAPQSAAVPAAGSAPLKNDQGIQVGQRPARAAAPAPKPKVKAMTGSKVPGIFPVYETSGRWMLVERVRPGKSRMIEQGSSLIVIGSQGVEQFYAGRSTMTFLMGCEGFRPKREKAFFIRGRSARQFQKVGTPIIAILNRSKRKVDLSKAVFYPLRNEVKEAVYQRLGKPLGEAILTDLKSGAFIVPPDDPAGQAFLTKPDVSKILTKIDFGSKIRLRGVQDAFILVEDAEVSKARRRCMRLFDGAQAQGICAVMSHTLMTETRNLRFVAYEPSGRGSPFILAYTEKSPLWGHERWGFRLTRDGPSLFLRDALDPRCRESF